MGQVPTCRGQTKRFVVQKHYGIAKTVEPDILFRPHALSLPAPNSRKKSHTVAVQTKQPLIPYKDEIYYAASVPNPSSISPTIAAHTSLLPQPPLLRNSWQDTLLPLLSYQVGLPSYMFDGDALQLAKAGLCTHVVLS